MANNIKNRKNIIMIIKLYTCRGLTHILTGVKHVIVDEYLHNFKEEYKPKDGHRNHIRIEQNDEVPYNLNIEEGSKETVFCKTIMYTDENDIKKYVHVFNRAYVCNDDGKTIEKISKLD